MKSGLFRSASVRSLLLAGLFLPGTLGLVGCASSGGGDSGGGTVTPVSPAPPPPASPPPPPAPPPPTAPAADFETSEYDRTVGLGLIGASAAYSVGATGEGISVAVIDTDIVADHPDLDGQISQTIDVCDNAACFDVDGNLANRPANDVDPESHGTLVAGIIGARRDDDVTTPEDEGAGGVNIHGVAYNADIIHVRADAPGSCLQTGEDEGCFFRDPDLVRAIEAAADAGADIINLSLGGEIDESDILENSIQDTAAEGVLFVISAGNDAEPPGTDENGNPVAAKGTTPNEPAFIAGQAASLGRVVAVGAIDQNGVISDFSNRAGTDAADFYILAPGQSVVTTGPDDDVTFPDDPDNDADSVGDYYSVSGTSFAAPYVAGTLALLLEQFPNLSPEDALQIILDTADDYVDPNPDPILGIAAGVGTDAVSGVGVLNVEAAFSPQGETTMSINGEVVPVSAAILPTSGAFGDFAVNSGAFDGLVFQDKYQRGFELDPVQAMAAVPSDYLGSRIIDLDQRADWAAAERAAISAGPISLNWSTPRLRENPLLPYEQEVESTFQARYEFQNNSVEFGRGGGIATLAPDVSLITDTTGTTPFSTSGSWAKFSHDVSDTYRLDVFSSENDFRQTNGIGVTRLGDNWAFRGAVSTTRDEATALGGQLQSRYGAGEDETELTAYSIEGRWAISRVWQLSGGIEAAAITLPGLKTENVWTSGWSVGAERPLGSGHLSVSVAQPRRAETGTMVLDLPVSQTSDGTIITGLRDVALTPSGRQVDFEVRYGLRIGPHWQMHVATALSTSPNHISGAETQAVSWFNLRTQW
ncbi:MAG: S8 family peptidase [Henriciella sp.]|nr:S8 family peptidase [Henriciella sp.]